MKTADLGLPENLEKLNWLVGKISGINVCFNADNLCQKYYSRGNECYFSPYDPCRDENQCKEATSPTKIINLSDRFECIGVKGRHVGRAFGSKSKLVAKCLALVYLFHGDEVPDSAWEGV